MTKIVINIEYDYLSLTNPAMERYIELSQRPIQIVDEDDGYRQYTLNDEPFHRRDIERTDPALIQLVEETNGKCCNLGELRVVEIPDDVEWEIFSWDNGREEIHEKHRSWSFNAEQNQVVCYDDRERKIEQIDIAIQLIGDAINNLMSANNLLKLNTPSRTEQMMQSLAELAETLKEESNDV